MTPDIAHTYCTVHYIMNSISHCQCMHRGQEITNSFVKTNVNLPSPPAQIFTITSHPVLLCRTPHLLSSTAPSAPLSGPPCPFHLSPPATLPSSPQTTSVPLPSPLTDLKLKFPFTMSFPNNSNWGGGGGGGGRGSPTSTLAAIMETGVCFLRSGPERT